MRGFVAKFLRREALVEMIGDGVPKRSLVINRDGSVLNSPNSIRALFLRLKRVYKRTRSGIAEMWNYNTARKAGLLPKPAKERGRRKGKSMPQSEDRIIRIEKPLDLILQHCQPSQSLTDPNHWTPHPVYVSAQRAAKAGRGDLVTKMARQFLPA